MIKPIIAIILMPSLKTSLASRHLTIPVAINIAKPTSEPINKESVISCATNAATIAAIATTILSVPT